MAELKSYTDPSLQILNFLLGAGGTKSATTQSSSIDPAVQAQLNTLLGQQMSQITPEGMSALIGAIFRQGAQQVPVLATQFAQSAGARANNNSPLNLANQQLQTRLADQAMQSLLTAQNQASATAARAADATRTTTSNVTKKARAPELVALPFLIGQIPNIKKGINGLMDLGSSADTGFGSVPGGTGGFGQVVNNPSAYIAPALSASTIDASIFAEGDGLDFSNLLSGGQLFADVPFTDISSSIADTFSAPDYGGFFFADGGQVVKNSTQDRALATSLDNRSQKFSGDMRGLLQFIANYPRDYEYMRTAVQSYGPPGQDAAIMQALAGPLDVETILQLTGLISKAGNEYDAVNKRERNRMPNLVNRYADGGMVTARGYADGGAIGARYSGASESTSAPGTLAINTSDAVFGPTPGAGNSGGPSPAVDPLAQLSEDVLSYFAIDQAAGNSGWQAPQTPLVKGDITYERLPATSNMDGEAFYGQAGMDTGFGNSIMGRPTNYDRKAGTGAFKYDAATGAKTGTVGIKPEVNPAMDFISAAITAASMAMGNPALAFARSVGGRTLMEGAKTGFASGGEVDGPGTGTSDSIVARLSDGEYVVPADVVEMLGVEFFDGLRDAFHTPVSMQRYHASGTTRNEQR